MLAVLFAASLTGCDAPAERHAPGARTAGQSPPFLDAGTAPVAQEPGALPRVRALGPSPARVRLRQGIRSGLAFDFKSGRVLWSRDPLRVLPIASLTKLMTALLVVEATRPREIVRITKAAARVRGSRMGFLKAGRRVRVETLLHGLLMSSGNDAAVALAVHVSGSERRFVEAMNARAGAWGLSCTRYVDPYGLAAGNRSCAEDLAQLTERTLSRPRIARIAAKRSARVRIGRVGLRWLATTNPLLRARYPGTVGLKTGFTKRAGRCLVAAVRRSGRVIVVVVLHAEDPARAIRTTLRAVGSA